MPELFSGNVLVIGAGSHDELLPKGVHVGEYLTDQDGNTLPESDHQPGKKDTLTAEEFAAYRTSLYAKYGFVTVVPGAAHLGGGNGRNVAVHARNLGMRAELLTAFGDDESSRFIEADLAAHGIGTKYAVHSSEHVSSHAYIERIGDRHIRGLARAGLHHTLTPRDIQHAFNDLRPDIAVITSTKSEEVNISAFRTLWEMPEKPFSLFLPGSSEWSKHAWNIVNSVGLHLPDVIIGNEEEAADYLQQVHHETVDPHDYEKLAHQLSSYGKVAICTGGEAGMFLGSQDYLDGRILFQEAIWAENPVDSTGAGDAAAAQLAIRLAHVQPGSIPEYQAALEQAALSGRDAVGSLGATGNVLPKFPHLLNT